MPEISAKMVAELRNRTGAGMMDCKRALEETGGDLEKATEILRVKYAAKAEKRAERTAAEGLIDAYIHFTGKVGVMVELNCETDFVARTDEFKQLARDVALQVASTRPMAVRVEDIPADVVERERRIYEAQVIEQKKPEQIRGKIVDGMLKKFYQESVLMEQPFVKDDKVTIGDLVKAYSGKTGEKVQIRRFSRFELGGT
ncbi:MAG TPA: translation elongation factor Ts [Gemmatimonadales bacterium]|nr:translation elongation factor Ts [Gemmatimonadales bacterium]HZH41357.1 translation elongation factor Ts [Gemmatimonadales bacterium]